MGVGVIGRERTSPEALVVMEMTGSTVVVIEVVEAVESSSA